jgi:O-antigen ligase
VPATRERRDWAFTWTLVFTVVLFLRPQDILEPLGALHLAEVSATLALVSLITGRLRRGESGVRLSPELIGVIALGAVILATAPFGIWMGGSVGVFQDLYSKVILVYLLAVNVIVSPKRLERFTWVLVLVVGYLAFRAVLDYVRGVNLVGHGTRVRGSVGGIMQNPNDLALNMVVFLPLALFMAMRPDVSAVRRLIALGCGLFMVGAIVASGSRGGSLGFAAMIVVLGAFAVKQRPGFVVAGVFAAMCALPLVPSTYWHRLSSITDESEDDFGSTEARKTLMREALQAFAENPLTGVGAGNFKDWNPQGRQQPWHETHNVFLQIASELGGVGLAAFGFLVFRASSAVLRTRRLLRRARRAAAPTRPHMLPRSTRGGAPEIAPTDASLLDAHSAAMAASLAGFFVCAFFASVAYNWTFYYLLALVATPRDMLRARVPARRRAADSVRRMLPEVARA